MTSNVNRRQVLAISAGVATFAMLGSTLGGAVAAVEDAEQRIMDFTGGKSPEFGKIILTAPEIAENGNAVPISVSVDSAMTDGDLVQSVMILAEGNPNPEVATFNFTVMSGIATTTTRIRLARTQNVIAVAKMANGSVFMDKREVKVTIGGCGG